MIRRHLALWIALVSTQASFSYAASQAYPVGPHEEITPGAICENPTEYRYPEKIPYCSRQVKSETKKQIIATYDQRLGYTIQKMNRNDFKIDHYIPLCMGGSNDTSNLWPQHKSVYEVTDKIEFIACEKMKVGVLLQAEAIRLIKTAKNDLSKAPEILRQLEARK